MSLFAIADLHLSTYDMTDKSMEVFGKRWARYVERLEENWRIRVKDTDTVVIPGDISWGISLEEAKSDLLFLDSLPGKKLLGKGNHDFWWCTMKKHRAFFDAEGIKTIDFLHNNAYETEDFVLAGTRGWFSDDDAVTLPNDPDFEKLNAREVMRLEASLAEAKKLSDESGKEILVFTHFPPVWGEKKNEPFIDVLEKYGVRRVYFGHIHGAQRLPPVVYRGISFTLIAADTLEFLPLLIEKP